MFKLPQKLQPTRNFSIPTKLHVKTQRSFLFLKFFIKVYNFLLMIELRSNSKHRDRQNITIVQAINPYRQKKIQRCVHRHHKTFSDLSSPSLKTPSNMSSPSSKLFQRCLYHHQKPFQRCLCHHQKLFKICLHHQQTPKIKPLTDVKKVQIPQINLCYFLLVVLIFLLCTRKLAKNTVSNQYTKSIMKLALCH